MPSDEAQPPARIERKSLNDPFGLRYDIKLIDRYCTWTEASPTWMRWKRPGLFGVGICGLFILRATAIHPWLASLIGSLAADIIDIVVGSLVVLGLASLARVITGRIDNV